MSIIADTDAFIRQHYRKTMSSKDIASAIGCGWTDARVRVRAQRLGVADKRGDSPTREMNYSQAAADKVIIRELWTSHSLYDICRKLNRLPKTVRKWAARMGLPAKLEHHLVRVPRSVDASEATRAVQRPSGLNALIAPAAPRRGWQRTPRGGRPVIVDGLTATARWGVERHIEERRMSGEIHCICGRPGAVHCAQHRALLEREGVL